MYSACILFLWVGFGRIPIRPYVVVDAVDFGRIAALGVLRYALTLLWMLCLGFGRIPIRPYNCGLRYALTFWGGCFSFGRIAFRPIRVRGLNVSFPL